MFFARPIMQVTRQIAFVFLDDCRAWTNKTREIGSCEECDARRLERLQDEQDTPTRTRVIPVVDRCNLSFYIAFGAVEEVFLILSVLRQRDIGSTSFFCATY